MNQRAAAAAAIPTAAPTISIGGRRGFMEWSTSVSHLQQWTQSARLIDWVLERIKLMQVYYYVINQTVDAHGRASGFFFFLVSHVRVRS